VLKVDTRLGQVRGLDNGGSQAFLGIPFAAPPVGELRWRPPQPAGPWSGVLDATQYPQRSHQPPFPATLGSRVNPGEMSEDMLYLNVWTPGADGRRRPVLVYIHGGGFVTGSANDFDPTPFARRHDMVVVSMNYRLGIFGFIDLSRFGPEYTGSLSLGFQDQIAALRWIRHNIADYGGDPDNITISGVSAGAGSVLALMSAPTASGLFHRAAAFSPGEIAHERPDLVAWLAGLADMDDRALFKHLKSLSGADLYNYYHDRGATKAAAVDGEVIALPIHDAIRARLNPVPTMIGTCIDEGTMLVPSVAEDANIDADELLADVHVRIGAGNGARYRQFLHDLLPQAPTRDLMVRAWYDYFRSPTIRTAHTLSEIGLPAWVYSFEVPTDHPFGPTHASDLAFAYNLFDSGLFPEGEFAGFHRNTEVNRGIAHVWTDAVARFVRSGNPNGQGLPYWPTYEPKSRFSLAVRATPVAMSQLDRADALAAYGLGA